MPSRGDVRWGPAPHKNTPAYRPWLILSTGDHPFADEECVCAAMTTQAHEEGIPVADDAWITGGSEKRAYASPWYVATIKHAAFDRQQGELAESFVGRVAASLHEYTPESAVP